MPKTEIPQVDLPISLVREGRMIYHKGGLPARLYVVRSGRVLVDTVNDKRGVVDLIGPGEVFGVEAVIGWDRYRDTATAYPRCEIQVISRSELTSLYDQYPSLALSIFSSAEEQKARVVARMNAYLRRTSLASLAWVLKDLADPTYHAVLGVDQSVLGRMAMISREKANFNLGRMKGQGVVDLSERGRIEIKDEAHLAYIAENGNFQPAHARG